MQGVVYQASIIPEIQAEVSKTGPKAFSHLDKVAETPKTALNIHRSHWGFSTSEICMAVF